MAENAIADCWNGETGLHTFSSHTLFPLHCRLASEQVLKKWSAAPCPHPWKPRSAPDCCPGGACRAGGTNSTTFCRFEHYRANQGWNTLSLIMTHFCWSHAWLSLKLSWSISLYFSRVVSEDGQDSKLWPKQCWAWSTYCCNRLQKHSSCR